mmetsp:Transcript_97494/g.297956  ORF Transcript_97494/g.297956 Transcript_97494/m.297956 type:complete len:225 (+) Transcript_97494:306-980(+)
MHRVASERWIRGRRPCPAGCLGRRTCRLGRSGAEIGLVHEFEPRGHVRNWARQVLQAPRSDIVLAGSLHNQVPGRRRTAVGSVMPRLQEVGRSHPVHAAPPSAGAAKANSSSNTTMRRPSKNSPNSLPDVTSSRHVSGFDGSRWPYLVTESVAVAKPNRAKVVCQALYTWWSVLVLVTRMACVAGPGAKAGSHRTGKARRWTHRHEPGAAKSSRYSTARSWTIA